MTNNTYGIRRTRVFDLPFVAGRAGMRSSLLVRLADTVQVWFERNRSRRELRGLDSRILHDIGLSRYDAEHEAVKPFWRP